MMSLRARFKTYVGQTPIYEVCCAGSSIAVHGAALIGVGIPIPPTPIFRTWMNLVLLDRRCVACWAAVGGRSELSAHSKSQHGVELVVAA